MLFDVTSIQLKEAILSFNYYLPKIKEKESANTAYTNMKLKYAAFAGFDDEKQIFNYYLALTALHAERFQEAAQHLSEIKAPFDYTTVRVRVGTQQLKLLQLPVENMAHVLHFNPLENLDDAELNLFDWSKFTQYGDLNSEAGVHVLRVLFHAAERYNLGFGGYTQYFASSNPVEPRTKPIPLQDLIALCRFHQTNLTNAAIQTLFESVTDSQHRHDVIFTIIHSMSLAKQDAAFKTWVMEMAKLIPMKNDVAQFDKDWHAPILALAALFVPKYQYYLGMAIEHGHSNIPGVRSHLSFRQYPAAFVYLFCYHQAEPGRRQPHALLHDIIKRNTLMTGLPILPEIALMEEKATPHEVAMTLWGHANNASVPAVQLLFAQHYGSRLYYRETDYNPAHAKTYATLVLNNDAATPEQKDAAQALMDSFEPAPSTAQTFLKSWAPDRRTPARLMEKIGATFGTDEGEYSDDDDAVNNTTPGASL